MGPTRTRASAGKKPRGNSHPGMAAPKGSPPSHQTTTNTITKGGGPSGVYVQKDIDKFERTSSNMEVT